MPDFADQLLAELDASRDQWPLDREKCARGKVAEGRAFRKNDREQLMLLQGWDRDRPLVIDPLARRIAGGWADFLFAEDADFDASTAAPADQAVLDELVEENRLQSRLHRAERIVVSEGETWWKWHTNLAVAQVPLVTFSSRLDVVPLLHGDRVLAAAWVSEVARGTYQEEGQEADEDTVIVWRWAEIHTAGRVLNVLYRGGPDRLGDRVGLTDRPETAGYNPDWVHGLPMLAGRVVNDLDTDADEVGLSEYDGIRDMLLALNEAVTIGVENARLTGKDRVFAAAELLQQDGSFDASLEVFRVDAEGGTMGEGDGKPPIVAVEKRYDAVPLWLHIGKLARTILSRIGLVPEFVGDDEGGQGTVTAPAMRLRLMPTVNAANGKAREWAATLPHMLHTGLQVARLPVEKGGMGRSVNVTEAPSVELSDPLPSDESETTVDVTTAVVGEVMSRRTAIRQLHPDWSDDQVNEELAEIRKDIGTDTPPPPAPDDPPPPPPPTPDPPPSGA